jgi:methyl coenzyme M reductase subunit C-like uncharacterized protein (methanogenesis marker protein 7)
MLTKAKIIDRAIAGLPLSGTDVATVSRSARSLVMRHAWKDTDDGRVLDGIRRAARRLAQDLADASGRSVSIYNSNHNLIDEVHPR